MDAPAITGTVRLGIGDFLRLRWNRATLYVLAVGLVILIALDVWLTRPVFALTTDALGTWRPLGLSVVIVLGFWVVFAALFSVVYGLRLSEEQRTLTYEFGPDAVVAHDATDSVSTISWSVIRGVSESGRAFRLYLRPMRVLYVPKRAFAAHDLAPLRALLREKLGRRAKLKAG